MVLFRFSVYLLLMFLLFRVTISTTCSRLWMITSRRSLPPRFVFSVSPAVFGTLVHGGEPVTHVSVLDI